MLSRSLLKMPATVLKASSMVHGASAVRGTSATMLKATTLRWLLPRVAISSLFVFIGALAFFESIYLRDQAQFFGASLNANLAASVAENARNEIIVWMWAFRALAFLMMLFAIAVFVRR